jgi:hypothetical protein
MSQPYNEIKASSIAGVSLDCDLSTGNKIGGGTATDNTAAINAVLATASATNPIKLILDGSSLVTGLVMATLGNTWIEGIGRQSGIFVKSGANADAINNGKILPYDPQTIPPARGGSVKISNFQINGNRGNGTTGNSTSGNPRGATGPVYWYSNINLSNLQGVAIEDMYSYDSPAYSYRFDNCGDVLVVGCTILNPNTTVTANQDCIHVDGPSDNIRIAFNNLNNGNSDDAIAINATEGYGGIIDRVVIEGNIIFNTTSALRVYGTIEAEVGQLVFANNVGFVTGAFGGIIIGTGTSENPDESGRTLLFTGNRLTVSGTAFFAITDKVGDITITDCEWLSPTAAIPFINLVPNGGGGANTIAGLSINNCRVFRTDAGSSLTPLLSAGATSTIARMAINGFSLVDQEGQSYSAVANLILMTNLTISNLHIAALDYSKITALADSFTNITNLTGQYQPEGNIQSKTGAYTLLPTDRNILGNTTAAGFAVALPAKSYAGEKHTIKNTGTANTLTITGTVDGSANPTLTTLASMTILYDGTAFWKI